MTPFLEGAIAGYGIAIPVGAIAILIIDAGMRRGFWSGFAAGAGAASADLFFASLAAIAGQALANALTPFASVLRLVSALVLIGMGAYGLWRARAAPARNGRGHAPPLQARHTFIQTYAQFLALTLLNPMTIAYFAALILGNGTGTLGTPADRAAFVAGAVLASLSWQSLLAAIGALAHKRFSPRAQRATAIIGNLVIVALGARLMV